MRIGIDISQIVYEGTGVGTYVRQIVSHLVRTDTANEYILFGASLRKSHRFRKFYDSLAVKERVKLVSIPVPPTILEFFWNVLHVIPVEWFTGPLDVFWSSDWTQPPLVRARAVTTIHDLAVYRYPESFPEKIVSVQKRRLFHVKRECRSIFCDSESAKLDIVELLRIPPERIHVVYPGFSL